MSNLFSSFFFPFFRISKFQNFNLHGPASILKYPKSIKLRQTQFHMKDTGKSSSRKLRYIIYYTLCRIDAQKIHYKISCSAKIPKIKHFDLFVYISPLTPDQPPLKGGHYVKILCAGTMHDIMHGAHNTAPGTRRLEQVVCNSSVNGRAPGNPQMDTEDDSMTPNSCKYQ